MPSSLKTAAAGGRLILAISKETQGEPRFQVDWGLQTAQVFGVDVDDLAPGAVVTIDDSAPGHPLKKLTGLPPGKYNVQAVLNVYETVRRSDDRVLKLPMDDGEGQHWNRSPGNLFSKPALAEIAADSVTELALTEVIPPIDSPKATRYIRHFRMQSDLLTAFWGRPVYIGALVMVPEHYDEEPDKRYPVAYHQGHFPSGFPWFRETPGAADDKRAQLGHRFYQEWTSGRLPKLLIVMTQHATPFYDDSYGVNTANVGPYGDALTKEFTRRWRRSFARSVSLGPGLSMAARLAGG